MEAIGRLAGGVAHDFNNLLMAIHGYAEMLVQNLDEGDERRSDAEEILKAAERAAGLTRQLLAFGRRQVITQQAVALDQLVEGMRNMLQRVIGPEMQIATEIWPDLTPVLADSTQVEQILMNLVINARDAMPGGGRITIELRNIELDKIGVAAHPGLQPGDYVEMAISDTGSGMDRETASRIFEPFFTTKEGGKGTGLGTRHGLRHRAAEQRRHRSAEPRGARHDVLHLSAARHGPRQARARHDRGPDDWNGDDSARRRRRSRARAGREHAQEERLHGAAGIGWRSGAGDRGRAITAASICS